MPQSAETRYLLAVAYGGQRDRLRSREGLEAALALDPEHFAAKRSLAVTLSQDGEVDEAARLVAELRERAPEDPTLLQMAGVVALQQERFDDAVGVYGSLMALRPSSSTAVSLAVALERSSEPEKAEDTLQQWLRQNPDERSVRFALANLYLGQNRYSAAREAYEVLLVAGPDDVALLNNLAWVMHREGNAEAALVHAQRALELAANEPRIMDTVGTILLSVGEADRALRLLRRAAELRPDSHDIRTHLAQALAADGDVAGARTILTGLLTDGAEFEERPRAEALLGELGG